MSAPGALAATASVLLFAALIVAFVADNSRFWTERLANIGWALFAAACLSFIGAAWWAVIA